MRTTEQDYIDAFGYSGRLFPLLNKKVNTPSGWGTLVQVFGTDVKVALDKEPKKMKRFFSDQITEI